MSKIFSVLLYAENGRTIIFDTQLYSVDEERLELDKPYLKKLTFMYCEYLKAPYQRFN